MCELNPKMAGGVLAEPRTTTQTLIIAALLRDALAADVAPQTVKKDELRRRAQTGVWVALADQQERREWSWLGSGEPLAPSEARWAAGEPDLDWPAEGLCLELLADGTWTDRDCAEERRYACEVPVGRV